MPNYSNSPLGLLLTSESTDSPVVGKYIISGSSSLASIFFDTNSNNSQSYKFKPNAGPSSTYNSDISTLGIINYTSKISSMKLKYSDFAYLKNLGVYPNNRLVIARRFSSPISDDLTALNNVVPISTLVSWVPDNTEFISTTYGEDWVAGDASFREILNELGNDILMADNSGKGLGSFIGQGGGIVPYAGFTEGLQYEVFKNLGLTDTDASNLPYGNPNLIRESKRRNTAGKEGAWSGLKCKFKVKMTVEYEQKFINGVDPTIVYYDIIANALAFGTSESQFQFRGGAGAKFKSFLDDMGSGDNGRIQKALLHFVSILADALHDIGHFILNLFDPKTTSNAIADPKKAATDAANAFGSKLVNIANTIITGLVNKYKIRIVSVVNSLTGTPSAPWHVTIGNPRRPIFSSGDMVMENVTITMGKTLAFNDLPSSIKLEFELESARNIGSQEIFQKFNCGKERTYIQLKSSFVDTDGNFNATQISTSTNNNPSKSILPNISGGNITSANNSILQSQQAGQQVYPSAITGLPGASFITNNAGTNADGSTDYNIVTQAPISQINNQQVQFYPSGLVTDTNGNYLGNWTPNGNNVNLNLNNNKTGLPSGSTIVLPAV